MDASSLMRLIFLDKNELTLGVLLVLFLVVTAALLFRSASEAGKSGAVASVGAEDIEVALESALKKTIGNSEGLKALAKTHGAGVSSSLASGSTGDAKQLADALAEREATISALQADIAVMAKQVDEAKMHAQNASQSVAGSSDSSGDTGKGSMGGGGATDSDRAQLEAKLAELQAKLAEYEIIEDDIADLSLFKEENRKLKAEIEALKSAPAQPVALAPAAPVAAQQPEGIAPAPKPSLIADDEAAPLKFEKSTKFELDPADDVMKEFASAIGGEEPSENSTKSSTQSAEAEQGATAKREAIPDPLSQLITSAETAVTDPQAAIDALLKGAEAESAVAESLSSTSVTASTSSPETSREDSYGGELVASIDTDKLMSEVQSLEASGESDDSGLESSIDTDKLMNEMQSSAESLGSADGHVARDTESASEPVDDVLAEFEDEDFGKESPAKASGQS